MRTLSIFALLTFATATSTFAESTFTSLAPPVERPYPYEILGLQPGDLFEDVLGVLEHDLHALRYRGVMELAWAGCDDDEIMSYSGHKTKKMVIKYAGFARQVMRAETAAEKRKRWEQLLNETSTKQETDT